jgi:hypothetical protein
MRDISLPVHERKPALSQPDMFGSAVAPSTSILDLAVEMPDACDTCGSRLAVTQSSRGPHFGRYTCASCRAHRRWMSAATYRYLTTIVARFGRPHEPIRTPALTTKGHDMNLSEMFPSRFLKAGDLKGRPRVATIAGLQHEQFGDGTQKWVMAFVGWPKTLPLNKTNGFAVGDLYGPNTENWIGKRILVAEEMVTFKNERKNSIRLKAPPPQAPTAVTVPDTPPPDEDPDEGIPC